MTAPEPADHPFHQPHHDADVPSAIGGAAGRITYWVDHRHDPAAQLRWSSRQTAMRSALAVWTTVEQAAGVLAYRHDLDAFEAQELLFYLAEAQHAEVGQVADEIVRDAYLP